MARYLLLRLLHSAVVLVVLSAVTYALMHFAPGGPSVLMSPDIGAEEAARMRANLGLDAPLHMQYLSWVSTVVRADFGRSFTDARPVRELIAERLPNTLLLSGAALLVALVLGVSGGIVSALKRGTIWDRLISFLSMIGVSIPLFWLAIIAILIFAVRLRVLPSSGMSTIGADWAFDDALRHLIMPASVLSTVFIAQFARYTRAEMISVLGLDYIRTARAKGLAGRTVVLRHALRNALIPLVTVIGLAVPVLVGGAAITETIFGWPGMGRLAVDAAFRRDYPVVMGVTVLFAVVVIVANLLVDVLYCYLDPRVKLG
jgi:peptide/nickel transport system permease protein